MSEEMLADQVAAESLSMAENYMASNGPATARRGFQEVMTKAQLEQQKVNESMGYPSNLSEASRLQALEKEVGGIKSGIGAILDKLNGGTNVPVQPQLSAPTALASLAQPVPVPSLRKVVRPQPQGPTLVAPPMTQTYADQELLPTNCETSTCEPIPSETTSLELLEAEPQLSSEDMWFDPVPELPKANPTVERLATLMPSVVSYIKGRNCRAYFFNSTRRAITRHFEFEAWPIPMRDAFLRSFNTLLSDPIFLKTQVLGVLRFSQGFAMSIEKVAQMVIMSAGWMAFSLAAAECNS
jgi:hypothetical protein